MELGWHFVSYVAVAALILVCEFSDARPSTDSLYATSGAKDSQDKKSKNDTHTTGNTPSKMDSMKDSFHSSMDSLYGDHVYSGAIHPISGAVPKKLPRKNKKSSNITTTPGNTQSAMNSMKGNTQPAINSMKGNTQSAMNSMKGNTQPAMDSTKENTQPSMDSKKGNEYSASYSMYGDHVYSGTIHPISGAVPKKLPRKNKKAKRIFDKLSIDLSQIDLSQIDSTHKFDGKDSLQPSLCDDTYNDRYGVGKHFVRGARDVAFALVNGVEGLVDGLLADIPLVPNITSGVGGGLKAIICAIENGFSDIAGDLDSGLDIAKNGLVDLFKLKGPHPVLDIPVGIAGIAGEAVKGAGQLVGDAVGGVKNAVGEVLDAL